MNGDGLAAGLEPARTGVLARRALPDEATGTVARSGGDGAASDEPSAPVSALVPTLGVLEAAAGMRLIDLNQSLDRPVGETNFRADPELVKAILDRHR